MVDKFNESISNIAKEIAENNASAREKICIQELKKIIHEVIKSGDLVQYTRNYNDYYSNDYYSLSYIPYREKIRLELQFKSLIEQMEATVEQLNCYLEKYKK